ncbi:hypothetical protein B0H11DRAFT_2230481 [Mycena galericulata]|nr:hypothetical protein B0H11DRAFT_2230481 [Mycena galericulata]
MPEEYTAWRLLRRAEGLAGLMRTTEEVSHDNLMERRWLRTAVHSFSPDATSIASLISPVTMSSNGRCALPFHPDPGQPKSVASGQKIYLVSGPDCQKAGAYVSWPSASAEYNRYATASLKTYYLWSLAESAWWAACERGEHTHHISTSKKNKAVSSPGRPAPSPSKARSPRLKKDPVPVFHIPSRSPSPEPSKSYASPSRSKYAPAAGLGLHSPAAARPKPAAAAAAALSVGRQVYAVRCRDGLGGAVFSSFSEARDWYHAKHAAGLVPALLTADSLTVGVNLLEEFLDVDPKMTERASLIEEEARARRRKVKADIERAKHRREVLEKLEEVRESSESAHSSDESDVSRSTASLESELGARMSHGDEWRYYRTDGGHGQA